jgi:hypothetical protein
MPPFYIACLVAGLRSDRFTVVNLKRSAALGDPNPPVEKMGADLHLESLGNEKLPFAIRLRYYCINSPYAVETSSRIS